MLSKRPVLRITASSLSSFRYFRPIFIVIRCFAAILLDTRTALSDLGWTFAAGSEVSGFYFVLAF